MTLLLGVMASGPYADFTAARDRAAALSADQQALAAAVEELAAEAERLEDPDALEELARDELGLVAPGEIPFIVVNPPSEAPQHSTGLATEVAQEQQNRPWFVRAFDAVRSLLR